MRVPSAEHVNLTAIHLHGWSIGWKVYTRKKQLGSRVEEDASRRADRQINIGRSRFIVMHPRYCVSKTLYVYPSAGGVHVHTAACPEFKGGESISSREGSGIETEEKKEETKLGEGKGERKEWDEGDKQRRLSCREEAWKISSIVVPLFFEAGEVFLNFGTTWSDSQRLLTFLRYKLIS